MNQSDKLDKLVEALVGFHAEVGTIRKDSTNPFFGSKYASLSTILSQVLPVLTKHGLTIIQLPSGTGLTTTLAHTSGQFISQTMDLMPVKADPQAQGSAITYARRYAVSAVLSLNVDEDDDGNAATAPATAPAPKRTAPQAVPQGDDKPWFNAIDKNGVTTTAGHEMAQRIAGGAASWEDLYGSFKVSKKDRAEVERLVAEYRQQTAHPTRAEQAEYEDEPLPF
jgi:hypothetical protein